MLLSEDISEAGLVKNYAITISIHFSSTLSYSSELIDSELDKTQYIPQFEIYNINT